MLNAYMTDTVTLVKKSGAVSWSEQAETEITSKARVDYKNRMVRDVEGNMVVSSALIYLPVTTLTVDDRIKYQGREHSIISIFRPKAISLQTHMEVYIA